MHLEQQFVAPNKVSQAPAVGRWPRQRKVHRVFHRVHLHLPSCLSGVTLWIIIIPPPYPPSRVNAFSSGTIVQPQFQFNYSSRFNSLLLLLYSVLCLKSAQPTNNKSPCLPQLFDRYRKDPPREAMKWIFLTEIANSRISSRADVRQKEVEHGSIALIQVHLF